MPELNLYYRPFCPSCRKVLAFMDEHNVNIEKKDLSGNPEAMEELKTIGGKTQVPCLVIDGKPLYESDDIISWLKENA